MLDLAWPFRYDLLQVENGRRPTGFRFSSYIVNLKAALSGQEFVVTGEGDSLELAHAKARFELLERSALISWAHLYHAENSNGWSAHPNLVQAEANAIFELVERDAVLSQWYSSTPFLELAPDEWPQEIRDWAVQELARSEFPQMRLLISTRGIGPSVTCLFLNAEGFGVSAHATRETLGYSIRAAIAEACRPAHASIRRDHWQATLKLKRGEGDSMASEPHALYYAYHEPFPTWIFGEQIGLAQAENIWEERTAALTLHREEFEFVRVLTEPLFVGFARHPKAFQLRWGNTDPHWVCSAPGSERLNLVFNQVNKNIHIVA